MSVTTVEARVANLLSILGLESAEPVLEHLGPEHRARVREELKRLAQDPASQADRDQVLRDFEELLWTEGTGQGDWPRLVAGLDRNQEDESGTGSRGHEEEGAGNPDGPPTDSGDDLAAELCQFESAQLAAALQEEHPRSIAPVLNRMDPERAGEVLGLLPLEARRIAVLQMGQGATPSDDLTERIIRAVIEKARRVKATDLIQGDEEKIQKMADILRSLDKQARGETLEALEEEDPETTARVKDQLYQFRDLLIIEDRSVQKLLAEIDTSTLAAAMVDAEEEIREKVMANLSRRARETLTEEMEFMVQLPPDKSEQARKKMLAAMQQLDQTGDLVMIE